LLSLLDLSAAFDCVDHLLLVLRLQRNFGLTGQVLRWLTSFLNGRTQQIAYAGLVSATHTVFFSVPQGSVLGPFCLTCTQLTSICLLLPMDLCYISSTPTTVRFTSPRLPTRPLLQSTRSLAASTTLTRG